MAAAVFLGSFHRLLRIFVFAGIGGFRMFPIGALGMLDEIEDKQARFYAYIGLCVSSAAGIEHSLFHCYFGAGSASRKDAAKEFYKNVQFARKLDLADEAVRLAFPNGPTRKTWDAIIDEVQQVCGPEGARNLISHNPLSVNIYLHKTDKSARPHFVPVVAQNGNIVLTGKRPPRRETLETLREYAAQLNGAYLRLIDFNDRYLSQRRYRQSGNEN